MELVAPLLLALLFVVFGLTYRGRGGCSGCTGDTGEGACPRQGACPRRRD